MRTLFRLRTTDQGFSIILLESDTNIGLFFDTRGEKDTCVETVFELLLSVFGVDISTQYPEAFPDYYQPAYEDDDEVQRVRAGYGPLHIAVVNGKMRRVGIFSGAMGVCSVEHGAGYRLFESLYTAFSKPTAFSKTSRGELTSGTNLNEENKTATAQTASLKG